MRLKHVPMILFSGAVWLSIGTMLLTRGLTYLALAMRLDGPPSLLSSIIVRTDSIEKAALLLISAALLLGLFKGRFVLGKTVRRTVEKVFSLPSPVSFNEVYGLREALMIGLMIFLGFLFKWLPLDIDVKGFINVTIGSALVHGALLFFKHALLMRRSQGRGEL